mgnify:CR=1 FL=1
MLRILTVLSLFLMPFFGSSQTSELGNWMIYFGNKKISSKWNWHHEVQYRNYNAIGDLEQLLLRTGVGYNLTEKNNNLLLGYGFINSENYIFDGSKFRVDEHRIYQQFITKQTIGRVAVQHRYRLEERFVGTSPMSFRFRYFLAVNIPLNKAEMTDKTVYLSGYNEIFIRDLQGAFFDRNRLYGGIGYKLNSLVRFELGYMNQKLTFSSRDQMNIIAFLSF